MARKAYKRSKRGAGRFVQLPEYLQASEAWRKLKPGPRALYVEVKRRFNGGNNGAIFLSHRDAAKALNVSRNTVAGYFDALVEHGFLRMTRQHCLGPSGIGQASMWALEEEPLDGHPAGKAFGRWTEKQKPSAKNGTARRRNCASQAA